MLEHGHGEEGIACNIESERVTFHVSCGLYRGLRIAWYVANTRPSLAMELLPSPYLHKLSRRKSRRQRNYEIDTSVDGILGKDLSGRCD